VTQLKCVVVKKILLQVLFDVWPQIDRTTTESIKTSKLQVMVMGRPSIRLKKANVGYLWLPCRVLSSSNTINKSISNNVKISYAPAQLL